MCLFVFVVVFLVEIQTKYKKLDSSGGVWRDPESAPTREAIWQTPCVAQTITLNIHINRQFTRTMVMHEPCHAPRRA